MKRVFFLLLLLSGISWAQVSPQITGAGAPTNPCANGGQQYLDTTNHVYYNCSVPGSNWVLVGSASGGNLTKTSDLTSGTIPKSTGAASLANSSHIDTGAGLQIAEAAAPSGVASSDIIYADSTAHRWKMINNNGTAAQVVGSVTDINTSDNVVSMLGGLFVPSGPATTAKTYTFQNATSNVPSLVGASVANTIYKTTDTSGTVLAATSITDNGTVVNTTEPFVTSTAFSSGASAGEIVVPNAKPLSSASAANNAKYGLIQGNSSNGVDVDPGGQGSVRLSGTAAIFTSGLLSTYNLLATAGNGVASVQAAPTAVTIGSGSSISSTSLCSTTACPAGDYDIGVYVEVTTACSTTGGYVVWFGWTDDQGAKTGSNTTTYLSGGGLGVTPSTASAGASLALASTANFMTGHFYLHTTGAATSGGGGSINYGTTATACGSGGPMVGKMYLTVTRLR